MNKQRVEWVDYAKGICITLVVLMHSYGGVEKVAFGITGVEPTPNAMGFFVAWAQPFRMPDFFMISGLFLASRINRPWPSYLDSKVVHFAYFYLLWMTIQVLFRSPGIIAESGSTGLLHYYLLSLIDPFGTLWFIYLLAIFFIVTKATSTIPAAVIWLIAAVLESLDIKTGWIVVDEFSARFVYFYSGYLFAPYVFSFADRIRRNNVVLMFAALVAWGTVNAVFVRYGWAKWPGISLMAGFIGTGAVVTTAVLFSKFHMFRSLRYMGQHSLVIYLAFPLFMPPVRYVLLKYAPDLGVAAISLIVMSCAIIGALCLYWLTRNTWASFLFKRPKWARLETGRKRWHSDEHDTKPSSSPPPAAPQKG